MVAPGRLPVPLLLLLLGLIAVAPASVRAQAPLSFAGALALAVEGPSVRLAETRLESARRRLAVAASPVTGQLSGGYDQTWGTLDAANLSQSEDLTKGDIRPIELGVSINVVPFGPRADQRARGAAAVLQAERALDEARGQARVTAAQRFLEAVRADRAVALQQRAVADAEELVRARRTQAGVGATNDAAVAEAELGVRRARNALAQARREAVGALRALSVTLGRPVEAVRSGEEPPSGRDLALPDAAALDEALTRRSDVVSARQAMADARRGADAVLRDNLPQASLDLQVAQAGADHTWTLGAGFDTQSWQPRASIGFDPDTGAAAAGSSALPLTDPSSHSVRLSASLTVPLDVTLGDALAAARAEVEASRQQLEQALDLARLDVLSAEQALAAAKDSAALAEEAASRRADDARDAARRYALGLTSVLDRDGARSAADMAALDAARARDAVLLARMRLALSLGRDPTEVL